MMWSKGHLSSEGFKEHQERVSVIWSSDPCYSSFPGDLSLGPRDSAGRAGHFTDEGMRLEGSKALDERHESQDQAWCSACRDLLC